MRERTRDRHSERMKRFVKFALATLLTVSPPLLAANSRSSHAGAVHARSEKGCPSCQSIPSTRIQRNTAARRAFQREKPCPAIGQATGACPGYVVDHIVPLKRGGTDEPGICSGRRQRRRKRRTVWSRFRAKFQGSSVTLTHLAFFAPRWHH